MVNAIVTLAEDLEGGTGNRHHHDRSDVRVDRRVRAVWVAIARLRGGRIWPVRMLRIAALVTILLTEIFNFVAEEFGALINVAVGLSALVVFSRRISVLEREQVELSE